MRKLPNVQVQRQTLRKQALICSFKGLWEEESRLYLRISFFYEHARKLKCLFVYRSMLSLLAISVSIAILYNNIINFETKLIVGTTRAQTALTYGHC